jgi:hypothetical protein
MDESSVRVEAVVMRFLEDEMYIEHSDKHRWINRSPSCFVSRASKDDVSVYKRSAWGRRQPDGKLYKCCLRLAAEDGTVVRDYESIPLHIMECLKQAGFIDA